jgi:hypothetical protein
MNFAHRKPERPSAQVPRFGDFHAAVDVVHEVLSRYYLILTHKAVITFEPSAQYNVYEPFRFAWITDPELFDYKRCE